MAQLVLCLDVVVGHGREVVRQLEREAEALAGRAVGERPSAAPTLVLPVIMLDHVVQTVSSGFSPPASARFMESMSSGRKSRLMQPWVSGEVQRLQLEDALSK